MVARRRFSSCLVVLIGFSLVPTNAFAQAQGLDWDALAREVIPKVERKLVEMPDIARVYRKAGCPIDITFEMGGVDIPMRAQVAFSYEDTDDDGILSITEMTWKKTFVSSLAVERGLREVKVWLLGQMSVPMTHLLEGSKVTATPEGDGWRLSIGSGLSTGEMQIAAHVNAQHLITGGTYEVTGTSRSTTYEYSPVGDRFLLTRAREKVRFSGGRHERSTLDLGFREQAGCLVPGEFRKNADMINLGRVVNIRTTMRFGKWTGEKRAQPLPRPPVAGLGEGPEGVGGAGAVGGAEGAEAARRFFAELDQRYLSLAASGVDRITMKVEHGKDDARTDPLRFEWTWRAKGKISGPFMEPPQETLKVGLRLYCEKNPLFVPFSSIHLSEETRLVRGADGSVAVSDPRSRQKWAFRADGRLRMTVEGKDPKLGYEYEWMEVGGGLLQKSRAMLLKGDTRIEGRWEYQVVGKLVLPVSFEMVTVIPEMGRHRGRTNPEDAFFTTGVRVGDGPMQGLDDGPKVREGALLEGLGLLPGGARPPDGGVQPPNEGAQPGEGPGADFGTGAEAVRAYLAKVEARYHTLKATERPAITLLMRTGETEQGPALLEVTWTPPGEVASKGWTEPIQGLDLRSILIALKDNPLLRPFSCRKVSPKACLARGADGSVTLSDPGILPPTAHKFAADGTLVECRVSRNDGERVQRFDWVRLNGRLLLRAVFTRVPNGTVLFDRYDYARCEGVLVPAGVEKGALGAPAGADGQPEEQVFESAVLTGVLDHNRVPRGFLEVPHEDG